MAYFAQLDENNYVIQVIVLNNETVGEPDLTYPATEVMGQAFIMGTLKLTGVWLQCSYNGNFRGCYPGAGYSYDPVSDVFLPPAQPEPES